MKVYLGSDHAGFKLKESVKKYLAKSGVDYEDLGNHVLDINDDYPDFSFKVATKVKAKVQARGILFCGSSFGACIVANKVKGVRAASIQTVDEAILAKAHNDVNVICLAGGGVQQKIKGLGLKPVDANKIVQAFLAADFSKAARHQRRVNKIKTIENKK